MANEEHLARLKQGVHAWNRRRDENGQTQPDLRRADLTEAILPGAHIRMTVFGDVDLSSAQGLKMVQHHGPSTIGIDTLYRLHGNIPEVFLRGAGIP